MELPTALATFVNDFRKDCLRELQKIQRAWPAHSLTSCNDT